MVVGEGLVGFHGSELRVMGGIHALIAEDTADLIDPFKTADDQTLEIELCLNAQEHIQIQRVVMGAERACTCTDFHCLKNRGIHLKESAAVKELTDSRDDRASLAEHIANLGIDNRIHIALTITEIRVGQAMEFFGQHFQGFREQLQGSGMNGDFPGLGFKDCTGDTEDVADIIILEIRIGFFADIIAADIELNDALAVEQMRKAGLAHDAAGCHTAGDGNRLAFKRIEILDDLLRMMRDTVSGDQIGVLPAVDQALQLLAPNDFLLRKLGGMGSYGIICHE